MNSSLLCADIHHHTLKLFAQEVFWVKLSINVERTWTTSKGLEGNKVSTTEIFEASVLHEDAVFVTPKKTDWKDLINSSYKRFNDGHNDCKRISSLEVTGRTNQEFFIHFVAFFRIRPKSFTVNRIAQRDLEDKCQTLCCSVPLSLNC